MPLQNRVNPNGDILAVASKGTMMGNRGVLHNSKREIIRSSVKNKNAWITCVLDHGERPKRVLMTPDFYTELFFLDEVTAFSAGHRPCSDKDCQKDRFKDFKNIWLAVNRDKYELANDNISEIDRILHLERMDGEGNKIYWHCKLSSLPKGAFVSIEDKCYLLWNDKMLEWSFDGYVSAIESITDNEVRVLTPRSIVRCFDNGFVPKYHPSASKYIE